MWAGYFRPASNPVSAPRPFPPQCPHRIFPGRTSIRGHCTRTAPTPDSAPKGMVWIPGGEFSMGAQDSPDMGEVGMLATRDSRPIHRVYVDGFWMDATDVTNDDFAAFVKATGYVTVAERKPRAEDFPGAPPEVLVAGSVVFAPTDRPVPSTITCSGGRTRRARIGGTRWARERHQGQGKLSGRACRLRRRRCVCQLGGQASADRSGVGVCRARRPERRTVCLGLDFSPAANGWPTSIRDISR